MPKKILDLDSNIKDLGITKEVEVDYKKAMENFIQQMKTEFSDVYESKITSYYNYYHRSLVKYEEFTKTISGDITLKNLKWKLNVFLTGNEPKVVVNKSRYGDTTDIYYAGEVNKIFEPKVFKDNLLISNWEDKCLSGIIFPFSRTGQ